MTCDQIIIMLLVFHIMLTGLLLVGAQIVYQKLIHLMTQVDDWWTINREYIATAHAEGALTRTVTKKVIEEVKEIKDQADSKTLVLKKLALDTNLTVHDIKKEIK